MNPTRLFPFAALLLLTFAARSADAAMALRTSSTSGKRVTLAGESSWKAPAAAATISQSTSMAITAGNSVSCNSAGIHADQSYYRAFTLSSFPALDMSHFLVESVSFGVELANDGGGVGQPITLRLYRSTTNPPTNASLTLLTTENLTILDTASATVVTAPLTTPQLLVVATDILVVEIFTPDGNAGTHSFFVGSNAGGQSAASFIKAASCGITEIMTIASVGFPDMHLVMSVSGNTQVPVDLQSFSAE